MKNSTIAFVTLGIVAFCPLVRADDDYHDQHHEWHHPPITTTRMIETMTASVIMLATMMKTTVTRQIRQSVRINPDTALPWPSRILGHHHHGRNEAICAAIGASTTTFQLGPTFGGHGDEL